MELRLGRVVAPDLYEGDPEFEGVDGPVSDEGLLVRVVVLHVEVGEQDDCCVGCLQVDGVLLLSCPQEIIHKVFYCYTF